MEFVSVFLAVLSLVFSFVFAFAVFHVVRFALNKVNVWRVSEDKKPFSSRLITLLSFASAFSFIL